MAAVQALTSGLRRTPSWPALAVLVVVAGAFAGMLSASMGALALVAGLLVLLVGLATIDLGIIVLLAVPATLVMVRVGGALSVSDVVLAGACVLAIPLLRRHETASLQPLVWAAIAYLATLVPTLILNRYSANVIEWFHEAVLIVGSLLVGWVVGRRGQGGAALKAYLVGTVFIAVAAFLVGLQHLGSQGSFGPVYLPYLHKNFIGNACAFAIVIAYARPPWARWSNSTTWFLILLYAGGIAASASRQAIVSAVVGVAVCNLRLRVTEEKRSRLLWFVLVPAAVFVIHAVADQLHSDNPYNSTAQRLQWFHDSIGIWHHSPLFGVGLRWWYTDRFQVSFQPPNAEFEMLTSAGLVGTAGFLIMFMVAIWVLARTSATYGAVALAVVMTRFTQGQLDLYWVAGQSSLLWLVAGIALGVQYRDGRAVTAPAHLAVVRR